MATRWLSLEGVVRHFPGGLAELSGRQSRKGGDPVEIGERKALSSWLIAFLIVLCPALSAAQDNGSLWTFDLENQRGDGSPAGAPDGTVYVTSSAGFPADQASLEAVRPNGRLRWVYRVPYPLSASSSTVGANGSVYLVADNSRHAVNPDDSPKLSGSQR